MNCNTTDKNLLQKVVDRFNGNNVKKVMGAGTVIKGTTSDIKISEPKMPPYTGELRKDEENIIKNAVEDLFEIESQMSQGGSQLVTYTKDLHLTVGATSVGSDVAPPVRTINCNKPQLTDITIEDDGTKPKVTFTPYVERVNNSAIPFGNYSVVANNKYVLMVGAGGVILNTEGNIDIRAAGVVDINSVSEMHLFAKNGDMSISGNHNLCIRSDSVRIETKDINKKVIINSGLGVARNLVVHGSAYIEGELYVQHITGPQEVHDSGDSGFTKGQLAADTVIGYVDLSKLIYYLDNWLNTIGNILSINRPRWGVMTAFPVRTFKATFGPTYYTEPVAAGKNGDTVDVYPHTHPYKTLAGSLADGNGTVRKKAKDIINSGVAGEASPQTIGGKEGQSIY
jgi:hypothetical protein